MIESNEEKVDHLRVHKALIKGKNTNGVLASFVVVLAICGIAFNWKKDLGVNILYFGLGMASMVFIKRHRDYSNAVDKVNGLRSWDEKSLWVKTYEQVVDKGFKNTPSRQIDS